MTASQVRPPRQPADPERDLTRTAGSADVSQPPGPGGAADFVPARPWRLGAAVGEGVRSALASRWLSATAVLLVCWAGALPGAVDSATVAALIVEEQRFLQAGGNVVVVVNRDGGLPALPCDRLALGDGIPASAAITRLEEPATPSAARGADVAVFAASAGIWRLLGVEGSSSRAGIVPASTAERLGLVDGDWLVLEPSPGTRGERLPREPLRVTVADTTVLGDEYTGVLLPEPLTTESRADACVVAAEPGLLVSLKEALPATLAAAIGQPVVQDRLITGEFAADYSGAYRSRPMQWAWLAAGAILGAVWLLMRWVRRSEDALYATMGADAFTRLVIRSSEWSVLAGLGGLWALTLGIVGALSFDAPFEVAVPYVARHVGATLSLATAVVLLEQLRRPHSLLADLKDR